MLSKRGSGILIVIVVVILVTGGGAYFMLRGGDSGDNGGSSGGGGDSFDSTNFDAEWASMQSLIAAVEAKDEAGVDSLSYSGIADCEENFPEETCWTLFDLAVGFMKEIEKSDLTLINKDSRQTVLSSEVEIDVAFPNANYQTHVYFARRDGNYVLVKLKTMSRPAEGNLTDTDGDGLIDAEEDCSRAFCTNTDPNNPDSDGDGWWDGVEDAADTDPNDPNDFLFK